MIQFLKLSAVRKGSCLAADRVVNSRVALLGDAAHIQYGITMQLAQWSGWVRNSKHQRRCGIDLCVLKLYAPVFSVNSQPKQPVGPAMTGFAVTGRPRSDAKYAPPHA
mmetsp:Transcript_19335/g.28593  ORF Transcript_19335/g.28593 Transcript_19335/m.28593 type:complete len:108 (+) Transcript_19335:34-357(+)